MHDYRRILESVITNPLYLANLDWGEPREGHPEGSIRAHISDLESNLETLRPKLSGDDYWELKVLIHTHDTFKGDAEAGVPISHPRSHASLARTFLSSRCEDPDLLVMVQYHDEPLALYKQVKANGKYSHKRFEALLSAINDWDVFLAFNIIDGCTAGKSRDQLYWLFRELRDRVQSRFTEADIID